MSSQSTLLKVVFQPSLGQGGGPRHTLDRTSTSSQVQLPLVSVASGPSSSFQVCGGGQKRRFSCSPLRSKKISFSDSSFSGAAKKGFPK